MSQRAHCRVDARVALDAAPRQHGRAESGDERRAAADCRAPVVNVQRPRERSLAEARLSAMQMELDLPEEIVRDLLSVGGTDIVVIADDLVDEHCIDTTDYMRPPRGGGSYADLVETRAHAARRRSQRRLRAQVPERPNLVPNNPRRRRSTKSSRRSRGARAHAVFANLQLMRARLHRRQEPGERHDRADSHRRPALRREDAADPGAPSRTREERVLHACHVHRGG